jgi:hypothetical protein
MAWVKSSKCGESGHCIEALYTPETNRVCVKIGQSLRYASAEEWLVFIEGVKLGEFDIDKLMQAYHG